MGVDFRPVPFQLRAGDLENNAGYEPQQDQEGEDREDDFRGFWFHGFRVSGFQVPAPRLREGRPRGDDRIEVSESLVAGYR